MSADSPTQLLSITTVAGQLSCSRGHVYNLIAERALPAVEIKTPGSKRPKTRVRAADLEAFITSREHRVAS